MKEFDELCRELEMVSELEKKYKEQRAVLELSIAEQFVDDPPQSGKVRVHPLGSKLEAEINFSGRLNGTQELLDGLPAFVRGEVFVPKLSISKSGINAVRKRLEAEAAGSATGKRRLTMFKKALGKFKWVAYKPSVKIHEVD